MTAPALALHEVTKRFGPIEVLHGVDFDLRPGEVHALIGENGAGKSTMMKILGGYLSATEGEVRLDGKAVAFSESAEAEAAGVIMIHQEFNLAEHLSVEQNIFLGRELKRGPFLDHRSMQAKSRELMQALEANVAPTTRLSDISVPEKQMVEIAKALSRNVRVLIMDEPTAVLTGAEARVLFKQVRRLRDEGAAILFTSHKLDEVREIADRVTVLRDGAVVAHGPISDFTQDKMATAMVGREVSDLFPEKRPGGGETILEARDVDVPGHVTGASLALRKGEILGIGGLVGAGRTELMEGLVGLRPRTGEVKFKDTPLPDGDVAEARRRGFVYLTEDRKGAGLLLEKSLTENLTLSVLHRYAKPLIDRKAEARALEQAIKDFDIRVPSRDVQVGNLSGGNQQKLLLAKTMLADPEVVVIDEPTRGIDIGTKQQIYRLIHRLAEEGRSIIVISSEMPELIGLCDRVYVIHGGRISGELQGKEVTEDNVIRLATGLGGHREDAA
ncbi:sugar ABC transporter ATP-binding protein [Allosediminivita pacifica]|uniref:Monosaccharide ABC transporter ATP-binding protein (CUT2 family) n=1 Tax=Allosediminivita pacifica TaxID=1267769 RepID=A0A2T6AUA3_9RHOB|nr:sugar ABC transporter ATP-binding protein [Allosediminivita pacifica]PTX47398.1 monosaccharide ABC transporter ATP-binding protein (CUT2 family) [Allosediminivita pacifica]GGB13959.1 ABC transporter ATP-binding protein [Allosediminivita pacifica]